MERYDIVLTTDRCMMSNHHGKEFIGFMATGPAIGLPEKLWMWIACPKMKVDSIGRPWQAPYGLRKIEAKLVDEGFKAAIIDPDYLHLHLKHAKVLLLSHHDYFALGPPSSEWWFITRREPVNRKSFIALMEKPEIREAKKRGLKIIAGGPAAWQWLWNEDLWAKWGVDTVFDGEGERLVVDLVERALNNEPLPRYIYAGPRDTPGLDELSVIKGASVNGLVEIMRGCPRGCKFCSVTLRPLRMIPLEFIEKEIIVNVKNGVDAGILHSEDVLLYGADGVKPRPEPLFKLHEVALRHYKGLAWSHASLAAIVYAERNYKLVSRLTDYIYSHANQDYLGVEVGIETGSVRLAKIIMPAKAAPYPAEQWPEIVEEAFQIMHDNRIVPAATLILGLPEENEDDVYATLELLDRLKHYRSLIVPMFFVPMGYLKNKDWFKDIHVTRAHIEVMVACLKHSLKWAYDIMNSFYMKGPQYVLARALLKLFLLYVKWKTRDLEKLIASRFGVQLGSRDEQSHLQRSHGTPQPLPA